MKRIINLLSVGVALVAGNTWASPGQLATNTVPIYFTWPNQPGVSNVTWRAYWSTSLTVPTNQWPLFSVLTNPVVNGSLFAWTNTTGVPPGTYFFTMTGSNFWTGETFFSDAAITGGSPGVIPSPVQNFTVLPAQPLK